MSRKILYGYQIQNGELTAQPQEVEGVKKIFSLYLDGMTQQQIADSLNAGGFYYSVESPSWHRNRIMQALQNTRYMGEKGHPALIDRETFHMAQAMRTERARKWGDHPALCLARLLLCGACGSNLRRISERQWRHTLRFHCDGCGMSVTIPDADLLAEVERQAAEYTPPAEGGYTPSEDTIRLILQGISARYACFETPAASPDTQRLIKEKAYAQAIKYITITAENAVTVTFK